jgi:hypothetical protein
MDNSRRETSRTFKKKEREYMKSKFMNSKQLVRTKILDPYISINKFQKGYQSGKLTCRLLPCGFEHHVDLYENINVLKNVLPPSSGLRTSILKIEAVSSSETLVSTYKSTRLCNPEDQHRYLHHYENINLI